MQINERVQPSGPSQRHLPALILLMSLSILSCGCAESASVSKVDYELARQDGNAVLSVGKLTVVFENIAMKGGDQTLANGFFTIPGPDETRQSDGGPRYNELTIKQSWKNGVNSIFFNDYGFHLAENGTTLKFGDKSFAVADRQTIVVAEDGTASVKTD